MVPPTVPDISGGSASPSASASAPDRGGSVSDSVGGRVRVSDGVSGHGSQQWSAAFRRRHGHGYGNGHGHGRGHGHWHGQGHGRGCGHGDGAHRARARKRARARGFQPPATSDRRPATGHREGERTPGPVFACVILSESGRQLRRGGDPPPVVILSEEERQLRRVEGSLQGDPVNGDGHGEIVGLRTTDPSTRPASPSSLRVTRGCGPDAGEAMPARALVGDGDGDGDGHRHGHCHGHGPGHGHGLGHGLGHGSWHGHCHGHGCGFGSGRGRGRGRGVAACPRRATSDRRPATSHRRPA
jgi:hypothetical protein